MAKGLVLKSSQIRPASCSFVTFMGTTLITTAAYATFTMLSLLTFNSQHMSEAILFLNSVHRWKTDTQRYWLILILLETDLALRKSGSRLCFWLQSHQKNWPVFSVIPAGVTWLRLPEACSMASLSSLSLYVWTTTLPQIHLHMEVVVLIRKRKIVF